MPNFNRSQKRKLTKELNAIGQEGRATMLAGLISEANKRTLNDVSPTLAKAGEWHTYEKLFEEYVDKYDAAETEEEKEKIFIDLMSCIRMGYLQYQTEKAKQMEKSKELKEFSENQINNGIGEILNGIEK